MPLAETCGGLRGDGDGSGFRVAGELDDDGRGAAVVREGDVGAGVVGEERVAAEDELGEVVEAVVVGVGSGV